mmetsp:Transcript_41879/g.82700  ORF Transcript_41879/g.82700 Transcript_41879/m.82700 type:complete len:125 (+) Transcript_41879:1359-1733(+)
MASGLFRLGLSKQLTVAQVGAIHVTEIAHRFNRAADDANALAELESTRASDLATWRVRGVKRVVGNFFFYLQHMHAERDRKQQLELLQIDGGSTELHVHHADKEAVRAASDVPFESPRAKQKEK